MTFLDDTIIQKLSYVILCLLKLVWWDSTVRLCHWYLIYGWDLVFDCLCVAKIIFILCEDACRKPAASYIFMSTFY